MVQVSVWVVLDKTLVTVNAVCPAFGPEFSELYQTVRFETAQDGTAQSSVRMPTRACAVAPPVKASKG